MSVLTSTTLDSFTLQAINKYRQGERRWIRQGSLLVRRMPGIRPMRRGREMPYRADYLVTPHPMTVTFDASKSMRLRARQHPRQDPMQATNGIAHTWQR